MNYSILLDSGCSSTIFMMRQTSKLKNTEYDVTQWQTQTGILTTNHKVKVYLCLPELSTEKWLFRNVIWTTPETSSVMILDSNILTVLRLNKKPEHMMKGDGRMFERCT